MNFVQCAHCRQTNNSYSLLVNVVMLKISPKCRGSTIVNHSSFWSQGLNHFFLLLSHCYLENSNMEC